MHRYSLWGHVIGSSYFQLFLCSIPSSTLSVWGWIGSTVLLVRGGKLEENNTLNNYFCPNLRNNKQPLLVNGKIPSYLGIETFAIPRGPNPSISWVWTSSQPLSPFGWLFSPIKKWRRTLTSSSYFLSFKVSNLQRNSVFDSRLLLRRKWRNLGSIYRNPERISGSYLHRDMDNSMEEIT